MIYNVPIESLEERYSLQWNKWFPQEFQRNNLTYSTIYVDTLSDRIQQGSFLDVCGTNYFKAGQLREISRKIYQGEVKDGDIFFFHDLWFPGIEMLAYMRDALDIKFKICGILHAGTWDTSDFLSQKGMAFWAKDIENGWFEFIDAIFVATEFHKELIADCRNVGKQKIHVTGLPIYPDFVQEESKCNWILFPHRLDPEKQPERFEMLQKRFLENTPWRFYKTKEVCKNKTEYYSVLNKSKVALSFAQQETWGIAMQEAVMCGCIPIVPDRLSYQEMYPIDFRYQDFDQVVGMIDSLMTSKDYFEYLSKKAGYLAEKFIRKGRQAISNMCDILKENYL